MGKKICLTLIFLTFLTIPLANSVYAEIYQKCPDCSQLCDTNVGGDISCEQAKCPSPLCDQQPIDVEKFQILFANWTIPDFILGKTAEPESPIIINSVKLSLTMRSSDDSFGVYVKFWDCRINSYQDKWFEVSENQRTWDKDITDYFLPCTQGYNITIRPSYPGNDFLIVDNAMLIVNYEYPQNPNLRVSLDTEPPSYEIIDKYGSFTALSRVECYEGDCGDVIIALQYRLDNPVGDFVNVPVGKGEHFFTTSNYENPYHCGRIYDGSPPCDYEWEVYTNTTGNYYFRVIAYSESYPDLVETAQSQYVLIKVRIGSLSVHEVYFYPNPVHLGENTTLHATVSCEDFYCGNVDVLAKNGTSKIIALPKEDDYFILYDENPQIIPRMQGDKSFPLSWRLTPKIAGEYPNVYVRASSDEGLHYQGSPYELIVYEPSPEYGYLTIQNVNLNPTSIKEGESATLSGTIVCNDGSCGSAEAYVRQGDMEIPPYQGPLTTENNPQQPYNCIDMQAGQQCDVFWEITGHEEGVYPDIHIRASSNYPEVQNSSSQYDSKTLEVKKDFGDILISADVSPSEIFTGESADVTGMVTCTTDYCGTVTAQLQYSDGTPIGVEGNLSTPQNIRFCEYLSCNLYWNIKGNDKGLYQIKVFAQSEETNNETDPMILVVQDPEDPPTLIVSIDNHFSGLLGNLIGIDDDVQCKIGDCGEVSIYLQYKNASDEWQTLSQQTVLKTQENEQVEIMNHGDLIRFYWEVSSNQAGTFETRVVADAALDGVIDGHADFIVETIPPGIIDIQIKSPDQSKKFFRGDIAELEIEVTKDGNPISGLNPKFWFARSYDYLEDNGDGGYSGSLIIPNYAEGDYDITYDAEGVQESVQIIVDPSLKVSVATDKYNYETLENVVINGYVSKSDIQIEADLEIKINCIDWSNTFDVNTDKDGNFIYMIRLPGGISPGVCSVIAEAVDDFNNKGSAFTGIKISKSEFDVYELIFHSPTENEVFTSGDVMNIIVKVLLDSRPIDGADVRCADPYGQYNIKLNDSGPGLYYATVEAKRKPDKSERVLSCEANTVDGYTGGGFVNIVVKPSISIEVIEPEIKEVELGQTILFKILVHIDKAPLEEGVVQMTLGNETKILNYSGSGLYRTEYPVTSEGQLFFTIFAQDPFGNVGSESTSIISRSISRINWAAITLIAAGLIIIGSIWFAYKTRKGKTIVKTVYKTVTKGPARKTVLENKIKDLEKEKKALEKAKEDAEMEYYHREITEKEFRKMMENYEQELLKVEEEINEFKQELENLKG
jgi:hypothetical protein